MEVRSHVWYVRTTCLLRSFQCRSLPQTPCFHATPATPAASQDIAVPGIFMSVTPLQPRTTAPGPIAMTEGGEVETSTTARWSTLWVPIMYKEALQALLQYIRFSLHPSSLPRAGGWLTRYWR